MCGATEGVWFTWQNSKSEVERLDDVCDSPVARALDELVRALNALLVRELALAVQVLGSVRLDEVGALERVLEVGADVVLMRPLCEGGKRGR